jgi:threonine/homoserine/homoserine lactone efflux protein
MTPTLTLASTAAFAGAFFLLALSPGPGLAAILSRALGGGYHAGIAVTLGLVLGDALFLGVAMIGLSAIATTLGPLFQIVKYAGAAYLIVLGVQALRANSTPLAVTPNSTGSAIKDIGLGLIVTMGNPKPIFFYGALLPTFLDLTIAGVGDYVLLMTVVLVVSLIVYSGYMLLIERVRHLLSGTTAAQRLNQATGVMMIGAGLAVASR